MGRVLSILEVSQKQAYIFSSNKLAENIRNSSVIAYVTKCEYLEKATGYSMEEHIVYNGGGHVILEFASMEEARAAIAAVTRQVMVDFPALEMFAKSVEYDEKKNPADNIRQLTAELEKKKSLRQASFHQRSFGVEKVDVNTRKPVMRNYFEPEVLEKAEWVPEGYSKTTRFADLGGSDNSFIAVVHIDGNAMGKRVESLGSLLEMQQWENYKKNMKAFSSGISEDFDVAYRQMQEKVSAYLLDHAYAGNLSYRKSGKLFFPIRRVISEGDDLCFVANGKLGLEAAAEFIKALSERVNPVDHKPYASCAGVALVHQKYPFYRAYELAEELCSSAKRFGAGLSADGSGSDISCIDWHIEYGELKESLEETRMQYITDDGNCMEMRPYIVAATDEISAKEPIRQYENFRKLASKMIKADDFYGRGLMKGLRPVLKLGEAATDYYLRFHKVAGLTRDAFYGTFRDVEVQGLEIGSGQKKEAAAFVKTGDGKKRSILFDSIEVMDNLVLFGEE